MPSSQRSETKGEYIIRNNVWPVLSGTIGFAWYFARNKAAGAANKGTRKAVGKLGKILQGSQRYVLDFAFLALIGMVNWWIYSYSCQKDYQNSFYLLISTIGTLMWVIYLTASYTTYSLLLLTPLLIWLFFSAEYTGKQLYFPVVSTPPETTNGNTGDELLPQIDESDPSDPDKANAELEQQEKESVEQFRIW
jgi:hypothetical protein